MRRCCCVLWILDFKKDEVVDSSNSDKLNMLMFPYSTQEPQLSESELQLLDAIADEVEMERLRKMGVLKPPESVESSAKKLSARLVRPTIFMRNRSSNFILGAIDVADAFLTVDQKEATLVTACDSMGNKTEYSLGKVLPGQRAGSQLH